MPGLRRQHVCLCNQWGFRKSLGRRQKKTDRQLGESPIKWSHTITKKGPWEASDQRDGQCDLGKVGRKLINSWIYQNSKWQRPSYLQHNHPNNLHFDSNEVAMVWITRKFLLYWDLILERFLELQYFTYTNLKACDFSFPSSMTSFSLPKASI